jgi:hypothetical protein
VNTKINTKYNDSDAFNAFDASQKPIISDI